MLFSVAQLAQAKKPSESGEQSGLNRTKSVSRKLGAAADENFHESQQMGRYWLGDAVE